MEAILVCLFVLIIGACIGSFLNVVALRALTNESIILPPSKCPKCSARIKWYDNIPIFSYFFTFKGKCRNCAQSVSIQYPIVEALTSVIFLAAYFAWGSTIKTLLFLILFSISIVIIITDIKREYIFETHAWILIVSAIALSLNINGISNYTVPAVGLIAGAFAMEIIAKLSYYLIKKKEEKVENIEKEEDRKTDIEDENFDINEYIKKNKRAFGEGDTYLAAASGALLGWQYMLLAMFTSIILQAVCVLPQFIINLYRQKHYRLVFSLVSFIVLAIVYWLITNIIELNFYAAIAFVVVLMFFAVDFVTGLKQTRSNQGFSAIPFGPALLISTFVVLFWGNDIKRFLFEHIFI